MSALFASLSAAPAFAGRTFLTLLVIALFGRFGADLPILTDGVAASLDALPAWFTCDTSLWILGVIAAVEILADKVPEAREAMSFIDSYAKPLVSGAVALQLLRPEFGEVLAPALGTLGIGAIGIPIAAGGVALAAGITWAVATTRNRLLEPISDIDSSGETGLTNIISWLTDIGSLLFIVIGIVLPVIGFVLLIIALIALAFVRWLLHRREKAREVTCSSCGEMHSVAALQCPGCKTPHTAHQLAFFGLAVTDENVTNTEAHKIKLLKWRRCPSCAEKLPDRAIHQECPRCNTEVFACKAEATTYLNAVERDFAKTLVVVGLVGLVPVIGLVFGVIYSRLKVISGLRIYLGTLDSIGGRVAVTLASFILLWFQAVPFFGALAVLAMVGVSFAFFRSRFLAKIDNM